MVNPTLTAVNHWTLVTGRPASATGIVSNRFHRPNTTIARAASGYTTSSQVPALWTAARRQGLRVGTLLWPGADAGAVDRMGDFGIVWPAGPLAPSEVIDLDPADAATTGELISKDGVAPLLWRLEVGLEGSNPASLPLEVAAYDGSPDGVPRYDTAAARLTDEVSWSLAGEREWFALEFEAQAADDIAPWVYALWSKPLYLDRFSGSMRLLRGAAWRLHGYPDAFTRRLVDVVGPWPGVPDERLLSQWWLDMAAGVDLDTFLEQAERLDRYLDRIAAFVAANEDFRLLLAYHPTPDEYQHACLIVLPDQWAFTPGDGAGGQGGAEAHRSVGGPVGGRPVGSRRSRSRRAVGGLRPRPHADSRRGEGQPGARGGRAGGGGSGPGAARIAPTTRMVAITSGGIANIYLNLEGREPGGVVKRSEAGELLARAARALADLEQNGEPVVERIYRRAEAAEIGLDSPNSGDLIVFFRPGFTTSWSLDGEPVAPTSYYGQHGYLASHNAMCGMLFARGAGVRPRQIDELPATDVAPLVATWLGFDLP